MLLSCHTIVENDASNEVSRVIGKENSNIINDVGSVSEITTARKFTTLENNAIDTIKNNRSKLSERDQFKADVVRRYRHSSAFPSDSSFT